MIHKSYKPDGSPDLRKWIVECNDCHARHLLHDLTEWLVPTFEEMPDFCPDCERRIAARLIGEAFRRGRVERLVGWVRNLLAALARTDTREK